MLKNTNKLFFFSKTVFTFLFRRYIFFNQTKVKQTCHDHIKGESD